MSKSPIKNFSKLIQGNDKTVKKQDLFKEQPAYPIYLARYDNNNIINDLKDKLDAALRNNTKLLDQNSNLSSIINQLRHALVLAQDKIQILSRQSGQIARKTVNQRQNLNLQLVFKQKSQEQQLSRLLRQISLLHTQKNNIQIQKNKQIEKLKKQFENNLLSQLENMKNCQDNSKDLYEAQIRNLKQIIDGKDRQVQSTKHRSSNQKNRLLDNIKSLQKQISKIKSVHNIELQNTKHSFEVQLNSEKKRMQIQKQIQLSNFNLKIKKLKKDILQRNLQLEHINKKMTNQQQSIQIQSTQMKKQKQNLLSELKTNNLNSKNLLARQKNKLEQLNKLQIQNLTKLYQTNIQQLNGQNYKLKQLIQCKKQQLKQLYDENNRIKQSFGKQVEIVNQQNNHLKSINQNQQLQYKQNIQCFKIKMANLLQNDIKALGSYYENQLKSYIDRVAQLQNINKGLRQRVFKTIQDNDEIRKNFQIQISKQKARVQDLKIKMAAQQLQHKQQVSNLGSKVQLTSQTLIRQTEHKQKSKGQYQQQKKKYHYLTNSKDKQIHDLMIMMENMKRMHEDQIKLVRQQKLNMRASLEQAQQAVKRIRQSSDQELRVKDQRLKTLVVNNEKQIQQIKVLQDKIEILQKNNIKLKKQLEQMQRINASIAQQLGLSKGFIQNLQLQSNAAIQDERAKIKAFLGTHEVGIRQYFQDKLKIKQKDIDFLKQKLSQKQQNIRQLIVQYAALQKRFDLLMQTNSKLRQFQQKVKNLGLDNNLIKNIAQLFKK